MLRLKMAAAASLLALTGCVDVPDFSAIGVGDDPRSDTLPVGVLIDHIVCELYWVDRSASVPARYPEPIDGYTQGGFLATHGYEVLITLNLKVDDNASFAPSLNFIHPFTDSRYSLSYGIGGSLGGTRQRTYAQTFAFNMHEIARSERAHKHCIDPTNPDRRRPGERATGVLPPGVNLVGDLGITGAVVMGLNAIPAKYRRCPVDRRNARDGSCHRAAPPAPKEPPPALSDHWAVAPFTLAPTPTGFPAFMTTSIQDQPAFGTTIQFTLAKAVNGGPNWVVRSFKGPTGTTGLLNWGRTDTHQLVIAFAPPAPGAKAGADAVASALSAAAAQLNAIQLQNIQLSQ